MVRVGLAVAGVVLVFGACSPRGSTTGDNNTSSGSPGTSSSSGAGGSGSSAVLGSSSGTVGSSSGVAQSSSVVLGSSSGTVVMSSSGAAGMSSSGTVTGSSSGSGGPTMDAAAFYREVARQQCAYDQRCRSVRGAQHTSEAECQELRVWSDSLCVLFSAPQIPCSELATQGATLSSPAEAQACLDAFATAPCDAVDGGYLACVNAVLRRGSTAADGQACGYGSAAYVYCGVNSFCDGDGSLMCSVCRPLLAINSSCVENAECATGYCALGVCAQRTAPLLGEACNPQCANGVCGCATPGNCTSNGAGGFVCTAAPDLGEPCVDSCVAPGVCLDGPNGRRCVARLPDGSPCPRTQDPAQPGCKHHCLFATPDAATGTCGVRNTPLQPGDACINGAFCGGALFPSRTPSSCACQALLPDGAACDMAIPCANTCLPNGTCGAPPRTMPGDPCEVRTYCDVGDCRLDVQGALTCMEHECPPMVTCGAPPTNTSINTAVPWALNTLVNIETCLAPGTQLYWTLPPLAADSALMIKLDGGALSAGNSVLYVEVGNVTGGVFESRHVIGQSYVTANPVFAGALDAPMVRLRMEPAAATPVALHGYIDVITAAENTCPNPPTNTSMATATQVPLGQQVQGRFCSSNTGTQYHWRVPGPFAAGDLVELDATVPPNLRNALYLWPMAAYNNGTFGTAANCHFPQDTQYQRCVLRLDEAAAEVLLFAVGNPSLGQDFTFTFSLSRTTNAGWACMPPPTNITPATALPLTLNVDTNATLCGSEVMNTRTYWRVPGPFRRYDALELRLAGFTNSPGAANILLENDRGEVIDAYGYCPGMDPCPFQVPWSAAAVLIGMQAYYPDVNVPFSLGVHSGATFPMACANPPANQTPALAQPITLDTPVNGRACGNNHDRQFFWRLAGPLNGNIQLDVTFPDGAAAQNVDFAFAWPDSNGDIYPLMACSAGAGMPEQCSVTVPMDLPELYVMTQSLWNLTEEDFTLRLTSVP